MNKKVALLKNSDIGKHKVSKIGLIVQARLGSTRLPRKSLLPLAGAPLVARIIERLKRVKSVDQLILAVPESDKELVDIAISSNTTVFCGSEEDLLDRYYQAAKKHNISIIVRIPADNVASEPIEIDKIIDFYIKNNFDFCSNLAQLFGSGYPDGIGAEVFSFAKIEMAWKQEKDLKKREHIHLNFFDYQTQQPVEGVKAGTIPCPTSFARPDIILDVNTIEQYQKMSKMYDDLYPKKPEFSIIDIVKWWDENTAGKNL